MTYYNIKAIPTKYRGVNFRSRLEARWAAFFDLAGIVWEYEPFDLDGWAPDFLLRTPAGNVLVEVKPVEVSEAMRGAIETNASAVCLPEYVKAAAWQKAHQVLLLGLSPMHVDGELLPFGVLLPPSEGCEAVFGPLIELLYRRDHVDLWRRAGNAVQWNPPRSYAPYGVPYHEFISTRTTEARQ